MQNKITKFLLSIFFPQKEEKNTKIINNSDSNIYKNYPEDSLSEIEADFFRKESNFKDNFSPKNYILKPKNRDK
jgi:hypothetical protein